jgi:hypothetical protein
LLEKIAATDSHWIKRREAEGTMDSQFTEKDFVGDKFFPVRWNARQASQHLRQSTKRVPRPDQ